MDVVTTSLDALLQRATNPNNQNVDSAAVEAFCALMGKEKDGVHIGAKLLATRIHSQDEKEALHTFTMLDICMKRCNNSFHSEIGKFRFLNEMIKLVSPKYLGSQTPLSIRQKVLQLLYIWTLDFPKEAKIKEAYDMLKKQGVIREVPLSVSADNAALPEKKSMNSIFQDEEKNRLLQKLLQSKNPEDLVAANRLIKNMVKEDDKRAEIKSRRTVELESAQNNVRLLNEMLDSYRPGISSVDELELIKELHQSCERLRPNIFKLAAETQQNEEILNEVLNASDELGQVFDKYTDIIIKGNIPEPKQKDDHTNSLSLLDLGSPRAEAVVTQNNVSEKSDIDLLCDVFTTNNLPNNTNVADTNILKPLSLLKDCDLLGSGDDKVHGKINALDDLDALGEHLLKQNLATSTRLGPQFNKIAEKIPLNQLVKQSQSDTKNILAETPKKTSELTTGGALNLDLNYLINKQEKSEPKPIDNAERNGDDVLVDISEEKLQKTDASVGNNQQVNSEVKDVSVSGDVVVKDSPQRKDCISNKPEAKLNDIFLKLEEVKPSSLPPLTVLDDKNGVTVTMHFGKNKPREDISVFVLTTISKNELCLSSYSFQAVVPKSCKLKLLQPSRTELPSYNSFMPPSAITQIMLIANPQNVKISIKFIVSYTMDEETITEMGEVDSLPMVH